MAARNASALGLGRLRQRSTSENLSFQKFADYVSQSVGGGWLTARLGRARVGVAIIGTETTLAVAVWTGAGGRRYAAMALVVLVYCFSGFLALQYLRRGTTPCKCWGEFRSRNRGTRIGDRIEPQDPFSTARDIWLYAIERGDRPRIRVVW